MASEDITVFPYHGALLSAQLLSDPVTIVLGSFGSPVNGTLTDEGVTHSNADDGSASFDDHSLTYIGSGTAQAGVNLAGMTVGVGHPSDIVVFEAGGQIYFHYPSGRPSAVGKISEVIDIDPSACDVFTPVCFCEGTLIRTVTGDIPVEEISVGTEVVDADGRSHKVLWTGSRRLTIPRSDSYKKWCPVRIARNTLGDGVPYLDTYVSQQHRVLMSTRRCNMMFGQACFVPAVGLVNGSSVVVDYSFTQVEYHHILCANHVVLVANGMPAESMYVGDVALGALGKQDYDEVLALFPELKMDMAYPVLRTFEARRLSSKELMHRAPERRRAINHNAPPVSRPAPIYSEAHAL